MDELKRQRVEKLERMRELGVDPFPARCERRVRISEVKDRFKGLGAEEESEDEVYVAGRIVSMRKMGKAAFFNVRDSYDKIQVYIKKDNVGDANFSLFKLFDMGDVVGVRGNLFVTRTGELSINAKEASILSKSLKALPVVKEKETETGETVKYDEVSDVEFRYRQRYVDLNINYKTRDVFRKRSQIINFIRNYLISKDFLEVETPIMQSLSGGAAAKPFETYHNSLDMHLFLRIAPELYLKRIMAGGMDRVFEIGRNFRNEGISTTHNPEFTMLELYQAFADYYDMMDLAEDIITACLKEINDGKTKIEYDDMTIDFTDKWKRVKLEDLFKEYADIDFRFIDDFEGIKKAADSMGVKYEDNNNILKIYDHIFEDKIEPHLVNPTIVYDFPKAWSPLSKANRKNPDVAERFEIFIGRKELGNAYSELNNPIEQRLRMEAQAKAKAGGDEEASDIDEDYIRALEYGLAPCGGLGIGIDRLVMLFTNSLSIRDVIMFPHLRPEN